MAQDKKGGGSKASALLKTMGRGSPRTRVPEDEPETPSAQGAETAEVGERPDTAAGPETPSPTGPLPERGTPAGETRARGRGGARQATGPRRRERPAKPVRITVDLDADRHRFLRDFAYREDARGTEIVRALLDELGSDEELAGRVRGRLESE